MFVPRDLPSTITYDQELIMLLGRAERAIGELKGKGSALKNPHILLQSYLKHEAVMSSKIEGTLASIEDLNKYEALRIGKGYANRLGTQEVLNHVYALEWAIQMIREHDHDIDLDIIQGAHKLLMQRDVRGSEKNPGKFRDQQNMIIKESRNRKEIIYTPPSPEIMPKLLRNFEKFCTTTHEDIPILIQCAMIHYQFEAIHPFGDGNGRIGRLLILLMLCKSGLLPDPLLYLSAYFDTHLKKYYSGLMEVSRKSAWDEWVKFFLHALASQSMDVIDSIKKLEGLREKYRQVLDNINASGNAITLMESLFANPYISVPLARTRLKVSYPAASGTIRTLINTGILIPTDIPHKSKIFVAVEIGDTLNGK